MRRFAIAPGAQPGDRVPLSAEESAHALRVLRLQPGDAVELLDGQGARFAGAIETAMQGGAVVRVGERLPDAEPPARLTLYMGLPKFDKLDFIVQKATELGARCVVPVRMERSVVKLDAREAEKRRERLERIALEAAKQCGRAAPPEIVAPLSWKDALPRMGAHALMLMPWEEAHGTRLGDVCAEAPDARDIGLLIGPEGGISAREAQQVCASGGRAVTLGPRILRAETAALASVTLILHLWGDI